LTIATQAGTIVARCAACATQVSALWVTTLPVFGPRPTTWSDMRSLRSLTAGGADLAADVAREAFTAFSHNFPVKLWWFTTHGYAPHEWQAAFHAADHNGRLCRFRHLVAGRRGGKTMSAAWEVLFYCLFPEQFHRDAHSMDSSRPLWVWVLTKDHEVGRPARMAFLEAINAAGLVSGKDYKWNKTEKTVEFENGTFVQFKTADDPQSLRGAGLDILWIDEAAFITSKDAYDVVRPALSDKIGRVITTTTPHGKNWFWDKFFQGDPLVDANQFRVEYTSVDRPSFHKEEWIEAKRTMHPALFAQEYMASFDAMAGLSLSGDWLHYYTMGDEDLAHDLIALPRGEDGKIKLRKYIGVDPSTGESDDQFAISCIGISEDMTQAFLLDYWLGHLQFPDQVDKIREYQLKWKPELIGIESNAYQRSLAQQANRLQGFPGIVAVISKGSKTERLLSMSPVFKIGKVRISQTHAEFVDQWVSYDGKAKTNRDDLLDSVEIALGTAGVILPMNEVREDKEPSTEQEEAMAQIAALRKSKTYDPELGSEG
jgi:phage terminase large subunit-like protein